MVPPTGCVEPTDELGTYMLAPAMCGGEVELLWRGAINLLSAFLKSWMPQGSM